MYAKLLTSLYPEKIAQHLDQKEEYSAAKSVKKPSSDGVLNGDCSKLKDNDKEEKGSLS